MINFKAIYENQKSYYENQYDNDKELIENTINIWKEYRNKILNDNFSLQDYTGVNPNQNGDYLCNFLERNSMVFGSANIANKENTMVKLNNDGETYYIRSTGNVSASLSDAEDIFNRDIKPLFQMVVNANTLDDLQNLESSLLYTNYIAKPLLKKILVFESKIKECEFKFNLLEMYKKSNINYLYEKLFELHGTDSDIMRSIKVMDRAFTVLGISKASVSEKEVYVISRILWNISSHPENYSIDYSTLKNDYIKNSIYEALNNNHKQIVLTGAPGTGKTYSVREYVKTFTNLGNCLSEFIQFHPSYDYSDFVEGLRPVILRESTDFKPTFVKLDGTFKEFCRKVVIENYDYIINDILSNSDGKINVENFDEIYKQYENKCKTLHYFIIDEINRADLSKVFGELMYGLEESYRGIKNRFPTQYQNLKTYEIDTDGKAKPLEFDCFKNGFFIPHNICIIGTMNDIDKSVEAFDFALRRRFEWIEVDANKALQDVINNRAIKGRAANLRNLADHINAMNEVISTEGREFGLNEAYHIGHAYFMGVDANDENTIKDVFEHNIVSILKEYTRGRDSQSVEIFIEKCREALLR